MMAAEHRKLHPVYTSITAASLFVIENSPLFNIVR